MNAAFANTPAAITFSYLTLFAVQNCVIDFWKATLFVFNSQNPKIAVVFHHDNLKTFWSLKITDTVLDWELSVKYGTIIIGAIKCNTSNLEFQKGNTKVGKQGVCSLYLFEINK